MENHLALFVSRKTGLHEVVWHPDVHPKTAGQIGLDDYNAFLMATDPLDFLRAIEKIGPLGLSGRTVDGSLRPANAELLNREVMLDPFFRDAGGAEGLGPYADFTGTMSRRHGAEAKRSFGSGGLPGGTGHGGAPMDRLQDWVVLRNGLSVCSRVVFCMSRIEEGEDVLERAGFRYVPDGGVLGRPCFVAPFAFNPFFRGKGVFENAARAVLSPAVEKGSLLGSMTEMGKVGSFIAPHIVLNLRLEEAVKFVTAAQVPLGGGEDAGVAAMGMGLHLAVIGGRDDQICLGGRLVAGFARLCDPIEAVGVPLACDRWGNVSFGRGNGVVPALWEMMLRHDGCELVTCRQCGRTVLSQRKGTRKYCSDSCKVASANGRPGFMD